MRKEKITITREVENGSDNILIITAGELKNKGIDVDSKGIIRGSWLSSREKFMKANYVFFEDEVGRLHCLKYRYPIQDLSMP